MLTDTDPSGLVEKSQWKQRHGGRVTERRMEDVG
jgi:hypothetical protein